MSDQYFKYYIEILLTREWLTYFFTIDIETKQQHKQHCLIPT